MRLDQLQLGTVDLLDGTPEADIPAAWSRGMEVKLILQGDLVQLEWQKERVVLAVGKQARRDLDRLNQQNLPRIVRLADLGKDSCRLQVHSFAGTRPLDLRIGVDEHALETASRIRRNVRTVEAMLGWLEDQCLLDGSHPRSFLSAGRSEKLGDHFMLHGKSLRVRVKRIHRLQDDVETLQVVGLSRGRGNTDRNPLFLVEGDVRFVNATEAHRLRLEARAQLEDLREAKDTFMAHWTRYGQIEGDQILRRARRIGILPYTSAERLHDGTVRFFLEQRAGLQRALGELRDGDALELSSRAPEGFDDPKLSWSDILANHRKRKDPKDRPQVGIAIRTRSWRSREITLDARDADGFQPAPKGVIYLSLLGDATRLERRDKAREIIWSGAAKMPQLAPMLELLPVSSRVLESAELSPTVERKVFPKHPPTQAQIDAIRVALETPDLAVIQGPPGTGKTTVIRAIAECLNERLSAHARPGTMLITGFQHVAVENAIGRMLVNGLPPVKLGGGVSLEVVDERIDRWRQERTERIRRNLPHQEEDEHRTILRPLVDSYLLTPSPPKQTGKLLAEVERLVGHLLPGALAERLRTARGSLEQDNDGSLDLERIQAIQALRTLRSTRIAWDDDGRQNLIQVLAIARRGDVLSSAEQRQLMALLHGEMSDQGLTQIARVRRAALIRLLTARERRESGAVIRADIAGLLVEIREAVEEATQPRQLGPDAVVARFLDELETDPIAVRRAVLTYTPVYAATCQQAAGRDAAIAKASELAYSDVIVDEAARANPLDLIVPMAQARRRIVLVGDHKQLPHIVDDKILDELAEGESDESVRERLAKELSDSLFERLFVHLQDQEVERVVTLKDQFRMHPVLGSFVSSEFYEGSLKNGITDPAHFAHELEPFGNSAAVWVDVPATEGHEEQGQSKARTAEANRIAALLPQLMESPAGRRMSFGVISFYSKQVALLSKKLADLGFMEPDGQGGLIVAEEWRWLEKADGTLEPRLQVGTVDAFQGREFDVVLLSVTRSNDARDATPKDRRRRYGHLMSLNRMCVAMSRQKRLLIAVGDAGFLDAPNAETAIGPLVHFHELCRGEHGLCI